MSMFIRRSIQYDVLLGSHINDIATFESYNKEYVRNKYSDVNLIIVGRLGRVITRRRKHLKYRERHYVKLRKKIEEVQDLQGSTTDSLLSETITTELKIQHINFEETVSDSCLSQTFYVLSLTDGDTITISPPPRESVLETPFECLYCFFIINIQSTRSWIKYIFKDIKSYICSLTDCPTSDKLYDIRREWLYHEAVAHLREDFLCTLCKDTFSSSKQYKLHVARHLKEIVLFALPSNEIEEEEERESLNIESNYDINSSESHEESAVLDSNVATST